MRGARAARLLELRPVLLVVGLGVGIGDRLGEGPGAQHRVLDPPALRPGELRLVALEIGLHVAIGHGHLGQERLDVEGPPLLAPEAVGLPELVVRDADAVLDQRLHLAPLDHPLLGGVELVGVDPVALEDVLVALLGEASVLLELGHLPQVGADVLVGDAQALALGLLHDERVLHQSVDDLLRDAQPIRQLRREPVLVDLAVVLEVALVDPPVALGRDLLAIDGGDGRAAGPAPRARVRARPEIDDRRGDERHDGEQEDELQSPEILPHRADH